MARLWIFKKPVPFRRSLTVLYFSPNKSNRSYELAAGRGKTAGEPQRLLDEIRAKSAISPYPLGRDGDRQYWLYKGKTYWDSDFLPAGDVQALLDTRDRKQQLELERARRIASADESMFERTRAPIPDEIKLIVWKRDGGCCVRCGARQFLEYDHIIPFSMGGSDTERNLQLMCQSCNRTKGGDLV